jgi:autotransporter-associated beta strand protein
MKPFNIIQAAQPETMRITAPSRPALMEMKQFLKNTRVAMTRFVPGMAAAMVILGLSPARATITTVADYTFNDNATPVGFTAVGTPAYSGGQLVLDGTNCLHMITPLTATDNFGIEVICTPTANDAFNFYVSNNNGANNGWGLLQNGSGANYEGIAAGAAEFGRAGAVILGFPVRLALVRAGGVATVYKNGVAFGTTYAGARATPTKLTIGANQNTLTPGFEGKFKGSIDEVRLFTFAAGHFDPATDLLAGPTVPPAAPTGLIATPANNTVVLGWTASAGATGYNVKRSTTQGTGYATIGTASLTNFTDTAVTNGTPYYYVVSATNPGGEGADSAEMSATPAPIKLDQTITFGLGLTLAKTTVDAEFADLATATSLLPVTYSIPALEQTVATVDADTGMVTIIGPGTAHILADQAGDAGFNPAPQVSQTLTVSKGTPAITWATPADILVGTALDDIQFNATTTVSGTFNYTPASGTVLPLGTTTLSVQFTPDLTANYNTPEPKTVSINVVPRIQNLHDYTFNDDQAPAGFSVVGTGTPGYGGGQLVLDGTAALKIPSPLTATDNFAIEVICTPAANDAFNFSVSLNNGANNGWGLLQIAGIYQGIAEGAGMFGTSAGAATPGTPVRLALVRAGGVATVYKNGVAQTATTTTPRATPTALTIGANQGTTIPTFEGWFKGSIDEVRVFTFFPGQFDPATDLLTGPTLPPVGPELVWDNGAATMNWSTTAPNWTTATWQNSPAASAIFGATGTGTVNLTEAITASAITFNSAGYTLTGSTLALIGPVTNNADAVIASAIAWGSLTKLGDGTLTLTGPNTYPGITTINAGTLRLSGDGLLGGGTYPGAIQNNGAFSYDSSAEQTLAGAISGSGSLSKSGDGSLRLTGGGAAWNGPTTVSGGTLILAKQSATPFASWATASIAISGTGTLQFGSHDNFGNAQSFSSPAVAINAGGTLNSGGWFNTLWNLSLNGGTLTATGGDANWGAIGLAGTVTVGGSAPSIIDTGANPTNARIDVKNIGTTFEVADVTHDANADLTVSAVLGNGYAGDANWGAGRLIKSGAGTMLLTAANTYSGMTTIHAGTLQLGDGTIDHDGSLGSGGITNHAALVYHSFGDQTVTYLIGGTGSLTKSGPGTLTLTRDNTATGNTTVTGGTLAIGYPCLGAASTVTIATGAVMALDFDGSNGIAALVLGGTTVPLGTYNAAHPVFGSYFSGTGSLEVNDYGQWASARGITGGPDADDDGDGMSNQDEYAFGLLPNNGLSVNPITVPLDKGTGTFTYTRRDPALSKLAYTVWTSKDLVGWSEATGALQAAGAANANGVQSVAVTLPAPPTAPAFFIQVRAN